jgi:plastocyanin
MMKSVLLSLAALAPFALANPQDYGNGGGSSSTTTAPTSTAAGEAAAETQTIQVGNGGFTFQPNSITADKGDVVEFVIHTTHSVARSTFGNPCQPMTGAGAIWTGFSNSANDIFSLTINDTSPVWLYCAAPEHCQSGMAMVINPP